jgi:hypothetical protein
VLNGLRFYFFSLSFFPGEAGIYGIPGHGSYIGGKGFDPKGAPAGPDGHKNFLDDLSRICVRVKVFVCHEIELLPIPIVQFGISLLIILTYTGKQVIIIQRAIHFHHGLVAQSGSMETLC